MPKRVARVLAATFALAFGGGLASGTLTQATQPSQSDLAGLATVSGTVTASQPFKAGQVFLRNTDKRMLYQVYTVGGKYQAMHLFPGNYELSVKAGDLASDVQKIVLKAGKNDPQDVTLRPATMTAGGNDVQVVPYDQLYPAGPARDIATGTCIGCHGPSFLPSKQWNEAQWNAAIDMMTEAGNVDFTPQERGVLVPWLAANFGPTSPKRMPKFDPMPVQESALAKAMYIEHYLPPHPPGYGGRRRGQDPHFDRQGYVWVTDRGNPAHFLKLDPRSGKWLGDWKNPGVGFSHGLTIDSEGVVWLVESDGGGHLNAFDSKTEKFVGRYNYDPENKVKRVDGGPSRSHTPVLDSQENVWVSMIHGDKVIKWDRKTKQTTLYSPDTYPSQPYGISVDSKDNIYTVLSIGPPRIGMFNPKEQKWTEFPALTTAGRMRRLGTDSKDIVWYGLHTAGKIGRLDPRTGKVTEFKVPHQYSQPYDIQPDAQDTMWFTDGGQGGTIIRFDPEKHTFTYFPAPQMTDMPKIEITREGAIWYCPRSAPEAGVGVFYPDVTKISTLGAYYKGFDPTSSKYGREKQDIELTVTRQ